jgi:GntR family transcriptional regulator/MocR family aminotransferase
MLHLSYQRRYARIGTGLRSNIVTESWSTSSAPGVDLHLDPALAGGRRSGLEHALREAIRTGRLAPHARLPATRKLAAELGLSRGTVQAAYEQLTAEGFLTAKQGSGTVVASLSSPHTPSLQAPAQPPVPAEPRYDLRPGSPDVSTFPTAAWLRATRHALNSAPAAAYGYGDPRGRPELRTALAEYLGRTRGVLARPEQIVVTSGYVQALALLTRALAELGSPATAMEDPCLDFHREVVRRHGSRVVPLPVDEHGARTDLLSGSGFPAVGAVVLTPAHQYPTGVTLHPARRLALTEWARTSGGVVIEDDYDGEFRYDRQPVGAVQGMAPDHVAYVGTASKTLGPGVRLAWLVLPPHLVDPVVDHKRHSDHHTGSIGQLTLARLITTHDYDRHVRACRLRYQGRRDLLLARLPAAAGRSASGIAVQGIAAGLHALVTLPPGRLPEAEAVRRAAASSLALEPLTPHWHSTADDHPQGIVVGYTTPPERDYPTALDALNQALGHGPWSVP